VRPLSSGDTPRSRIRPVRRSRACGSPHRLASAAGSTGGAVLGAIAIQQRRTHREQTVRSIRVAEQCRPHTSADTSLRHCDSAAGMCLAAPQDAGGEPGPFWCGAAQSRHQADAGPPGVDFGRPPSLVVTLRAASGEMRAGSCPHDGACGATGDPWQPTVDRNKPSATASSATFRPSRRLRPALAVARRSARKRCPCMPPISTQCLILWYWIARWHRQD
jgi:hypothetical protein